MKKIVCLFVLAVLASCSSDDSATSYDGVLLKKIIETSDNGEPYTTVYNYNGNKLMSAVNQQGNTKILYTYSGNLITHISYRDLGGNENMRVDHTYDSSQRLIHSSVDRFIYDEQDYSDYTYNADGTISFVNHVWIDSELEYAVETGKIFFLGDDVVKVETYFNNGTNTVSFSYDDKHNPYADIAGFDKLPYSYLSGHNTVSETSTAANGDLMLQQNTTYTYNPDDYPATSLKTGFGSDITTQYFYE